MWLLDTVTLSETMKPRPDAGAVAWLAAQDPASLYTSTLCIGEVRYGIERLPPGVRRNDLRRWLDTDLQLYLGARILPFDNLAAQTWAELRAGLSQTQSMIDSLIAATALSRGLVVVTRNRRHFEPLGLEVLDPWRGDVG